MTPLIELNGNSINNLKTILEQNSRINFKNINLQKQTDLSTLDLNGFETASENMIELLKGYQRLLRIIPEGKEDHAFKLLGLGIHSALQICAMTRKLFMKRVADAFSNNMKDAEEIYSMALEKRGIILLQYINLLQSSEPHISAARFN